MRALIYSWPSKMTRGRELEEELQQEGYRVSFRNYQEFGPSMTEDVDLVVADAPVSAAYADHPARVRPLTEPRDADVPDSVPAPEPELPDGYRIEKSGVWHTVVHEGEKVGKSKRTREEAVAVAREHAEGS